MASSSTTNPAITPPSGNIPDLTRRADPALLPELMDQPCPYEEFRACIRDIGAVNRLTFAYRPTLKFLDRALTTHKPRSTPLRIIDVGSGGGDALRRVARWAARRKIAVDLIGIDLNPHATRAAREFSGNDPEAPPIHWHTGDVFTDPLTQDCDLVLSSLVTHHMRDPEIVHFLRWMDSTARLGWFINDLPRSRRAYRLFRLLSRTMRWHHFVQHDGLVSLQRAFRPEDWRHLLAGAGVPLEAITLNQPVPGRLCVERLR